MKKLPVGVFKCTTLLSVHPKAPINTGENSTSFDLFAVTGTFCKKWNAMMSTVQNGLQKLYSLVAKSN